MPINSAKLVAALLPALLLTGCTRHHLVTEQSESTRVVPIVVCTMDAPFDISNLIKVATQSQAISTTINTNQAVGPQLIAGDFLAWQCAIAGNYFEHNALNNTPSMFATVPADSE